MQANIIADVAHQFIMAEDGQAPLPSVASRYPELTAAEAYQVQRTVVAMMVERGDRVVGKKVAATNQPIQERFGLTEPAYGHLCESHRVADGGQISTAKLIQPLIECEVTFLLKQTLTGPGINTDDVLAATASVVASFEIVDFRSREWKVGMQEVIAYNGLVAGFVLGKQLGPVHGLDLANLAVILKKNGEQIVASTGAAVLGHPAKSVAWLANKLAEHHRSLEAGEIVLSGSFTPAQPVSGGDKFEAIFETLGAVSVEFV